LALPEILRKRFLVHDGGPDGVWSLDETVLAVLFERVAPGMRTLETGAGNEHRAVRRPARPSHLHRPVVDRGRTHPGALRGARGSAIRLLRGRLLAFARAVGRAIVDR